MHLLTCSPPSCQRPLRRVASAVAAALTGFLLGMPAQAAEGQLEIRVIDKESRKPVACRMHLKTAAGKPRFPKKVPAWDDHFVVPGKILLRLPLGNYTFEMERGPEYPVISGHFTFTKFADDSKQIELPRHVDMSGKGWWSGDLDVRRPLRDIELLMAAEDLHVVPLVTWWNGRASGRSTSCRRTPLVRFGPNRFSRCWAAGRPVRAAPLSYLNLPAPLRLGSASAEYPPTAQYCRAGRASTRAPWVDASRPYWWDLPMLVAPGQVDSIQVAHGDMCRSKMLLPTRRRQTPRPRSSTPRARHRPVVAGHLFPPARIAACGFRPAPAAARAWAPTRSATTASTSTSTASSPTRSGGRTSAPAG